MLRKRKKHIEDYGGNGEVLILLHGYLGSSRYWIKLQPLLTAAGYRVITIDLIGFGTAPKPRKANYDYSDHINHLQTAVDNLQLKHPFTLVGHSMGALIAVRYGRLHPERVKALVLIHQPLFKDTAEAVSSIRSTGRMYRFLLDSRFKRLGWLFVKTLNYRQIQNHSPRARERSLKNVIEAAEGMADLKVIKPKTLLIVGRKDRPEYIKNMQAAHFSKSVSKMEVDTGHHSPYFQPKQVFEWIQNFLGSADKTGS